MRKLLITLTLIISAALTGSAQQEATVERKLVYASRPFFVPHWYIKAQAGAAYDIFVNSIESEDGTSITFVLGDGQTFTIPIIK